MKRIALTVICIVFTVSVLLSGCTTFKPRTEQNDGELTGTNVQKEPFETVPFEHTHGDYAVYDTEREIYDAAELVFVGSPVKTFTDGEQLYLDLDGNRTEKDSGDVISLALTLREIRVLDVIKGDAGESVVVAEDAVPVYIDGKLNKIAGDASGLGIAKQDVKYIYYVGRTVNVSGTEYRYIIPDRGRVNVDGLDSDSIAAIGETRMAESKTRYSDLFEKYGA